MPIKITSVYILIRITFAPVPYLFCVCVLKRENMKYFFAILLLCQLSLSFGSSANGDTNHEQAELAVDGNANQLNEVPSTDVDQTKPPTVLIATLFRNKAHIMPLFFTYLNRIEYPKDRISLW